MTTIKEKISPYEENERNFLFQVFKTYNVEHFSLTPPEQRKPYDAMYRMNESDPSIYVEIKMRSKEYEDWILETKKLKSLIKIYNKGFPIEYWCAYPNSQGFMEVIIFKLSKRIPQWAKIGIPTQIKFMNYQTFQNSDQKIEKEILMLKYDPNIDAKLCNKTWKG